MTFVTNLEVREILCIFRLVLQREAGKKISESSRFIVRTHCPHSPVYKGGGLTSSNLAITVGKKDFFRKRGVARTLLSTIENIENNLLDLSEPVLIKTLLFGSNSFDTNANTNALNATIEYVLATRRFEEPLFQ